MDPQLEALALAAATTVVGLLTTDAWEQTKTALAAMWQRAHPEPSRSMDAELGEARERLLTALRAGDTQTERHITNELVDRLRHLLATHPELAVELAQLNDEWHGVPAVTKIQIGKAYDRSRMYISGGDQYINER